MKWLIDKFKKKLLKLESQKIPSKKEIEKEDKALKAKEKAMMKKIISNSKKK